MTSAQVAEYLQQTQLSIISSSYHRIVDSQGNRGRLSLEMSPGICMSGINKWLLQPCLNTDNTLYKGAVNKPSFLEVKSTGNTKISTSLHQLRGLVY